MSVAAILVVSDAGRPGSEVIDRLGVSLYSRFLEAAPYSTLRVLMGAEHTNAKLGEAIVALASEHEAVDVFLSVHATERPPEVMTELVPPEARKLRLVYSTACSGEAKERAGWEALGAETVVTHMGINNPLPAFSMVLARWIAGTAIGDAVAEGYDHLRRVTRHVQAWPHVPQDDVIGGSRPVVSGDRHLRITRGFDGVELSPPPELSPDAPGGPVALILRALAGRFALRGEDVVDALSRLGVGGRDGEPILRELAAVERACVEVDTNGVPHVVVTTSRRTRYALGVPGVRLHAERRVRLTAHSTLSEGRVRFEGQGLWFGRGPLRVVARHVELEPDPAQPGYRINAAFGLWDMIPVTRTFPIGGRDPAPDSATPPVFCDGVRSSEAGRG